MKLSVEGGKGYGGKRLQKSAGDACNIAHIPSSGRFEFSHEEFQFVWVSPAAKCTRRLLCQHSSVDSLHCGLSFP